MLSITPPETRVAPSFGGLDLSPEEWRLDTARYARFVETTTGIRLTEELSATDCYRIGNRLEAYVEERKRHGEWNDALVDDLPGVESLREVLWVARFFRHYHACWLEA